MRALKTLAASAALIMSTSAFAEGFYLQGGGGAGFTQSGIDKASTYVLSSTSGSPQVPLARIKQMAGGAWDIGLGYQINQMFGVEANYIDYMSITDKYNRNQYISSYTLHKFKMTTDVWQVNALGTVRMPVKMGMDFDLKGKLGVGYVSQEQTVKNTQGADGITYRKGDQSEYKMSPVVGLGAEKRFSDMFSVSLDYTVATQTQVTNSIVGLNLVLHLSDMMMGK